ncbi:MAG: hypothetical protein U5K79_21565 [Cyclobacteriaceae bacterium]|nr:hypothetical protein [Cyclobacteriaceae bacterium]
MTQEDIARISEESNIVLRNLKITQCYYDLSAEFESTINSGNANWCTFATWASRTAGISIRREELPGVFVEFLNDEARLRPKFGPVLLWIYQHTGAKVDILAQIRTLLLRVSEDVANGNRKVFAELAPLFFQFNALMSLPNAKRNSSLTKFLASLHPGPTSEGGQDILRMAFSNYALVAAEPNPSKRAQLMLLANCQIGLHEQTRLQVDIQQAMDAPIVVVITEGLGRLLKIRLTFALLKPFGVNRDKVRAEMQKEWQRIATRFSMNLSLPGGRVLPLGGNHIPWPEQIPEQLRTLTIPELIIFLHKFDDDLDKLRKKGADNWSKLGDRMGFICELFRSSQQTDNLFDQPFSQKAREEIARGKVPKDGI